MIIGKSIGQVAYHKPLARCGMEELAARQRTILPSGGVLFARHVDGEQKTAARQLVIDIVQSLPVPDRLWPDRLGVLTMPGVEWRFERKLLGMREPGWMQRATPQGIHFTACENDRAIFFASVGQMPGLHTPRSELKRIKPFPFAEMGMKTRFASFFFANIDDLMAEDCWDDGWDVVWLDYTGPLTVERLALIRHFYHRFVRSTLVVTALKTRFRKRTLIAIEKAGGHSEWLRKHLDGVILHDIEYFDTSAMAQFEVRKLNDPA